MSQTLKDSYNINFVPTCLQRKEELRLTCYNDHLVLLLSQALETALIKYISFAYSSVATETK